MGIQEITSRMKSIEETRKITNAMYLISSNQMKKAKQKLEQTQPFFQALRTEVKRIFRTVQDVESPYFYPKNMKDFVNGTYGILLITSDKGLAGSYNQDAIRECLRLIREHENVRLYIIGEYGRKYFRPLGIPIAEDFHFSSYSPTLAEARDIGSYILADYDSGVIKKLFVVYTNLARQMKQEVVSTRLLPFHREYFDTTKKEEEEIVKQAFEFWPSPEVVLNRVTVSYIKGFIYGALVDSYTSEENARIGAMSQANDNAKDLLDDLAVQKNRMRQAQITNDIAEVSAGAKAKALDREKRRN